MRACPQQNGGGQAQDVAGALMLARGGEQRCHTLGLVPDG